MPKAHKQAPNEDFNKIRLSQTCSPAGINDHNDHSAESHSACASTTTWASD